MGGTIHVPEGETARDDVVAVGGNVRIDGRARGDVVVIGGRLEINGVVEGSVSCVGGTMVLGAGRPHRTATPSSLAASLDRHDTARIDGEFVSTSASATRVGPALVAFPRRGAWRMVGIYARWRGYWRTTQLFYWMVLALLTVALVGDRVSSASHAILAASHCASGRSAWSASSRSASLSCMHLCRVVVRDHWHPVLDRSDLHVVVGVHIRHRRGLPIGRHPGHEPGQAVPDASQIGDRILAGGLVMGILRYMRRSSVSAT